tara:strand:+ start:2175 stop:2993 length:819 start_codon:yes stop_codon:yes gene_type:complete
MVSQNGSAGFDIPPANNADDGLGSQTSQTDATATTGPVAFPQLNTGEASTMESLQQRIDELEQNNQKQANDNKALQGRLKQQGDSSNIDQLSDSVSVLTDTVQALIRQSGTNDEEQFRQDLQRVEENATNRKQTSTFQRTSDLMINEIGLAVEEAGMNLRSSLELQEFRDLWGPAYDSKDISGLYEAYASFQKAMLAIEKSKQTDTETEIENRLKKALEEHGVNSLDTDLTPIPTSSSPNNLLTRLGNSEAPVSRDEIAQAYQMLQKQGIRL